MEMTDFPRTPLISGGSVILNPLLCRMIVNTPSCISLFKLGLVTSNSIRVIPLTVYGRFLLAGWLTCSAAPKQPATNPLGSLHSSPVSVLTHGKAKITCDMLYMRRIFRISSIVRSISEAMFIVIRLIGPASVGRCLPLVGVVEPQYWHGGCSRLSI